MFLLEKAAVGGRRYWIWLGCLFLVVLVGFLSYLRQFDYGLGLTGMSRNVTWGIYIGQFTFMVGVAASAVMVMLPYYLHNRKEFGRMTILGECLAISAVTMCMLFIFVDMGQPARVLNVLLNPQPHSMMFWDMLSLLCYLVLNIAITLVTLHAEQNGVTPPRWIRPVILLSIPWAISIHTVTAFLYSGLPGRSLWFTAIMAPRFLASAFASGPALLILLCMALRKLIGHDVGEKAIRSLAVIVTYAMALNVFFALMEVFTSFYSQVPSLTEHFGSIYLGNLAYHSWLQPWGRVSLALMAAGLILLLVPRTRRNRQTLALACSLTFFSVWIDKGLILIVCGFIPSPLGAVTQYVPTFPEICITAGIWAVGCQMITVLCKIAVSVEAQGAATCSAEAIEALRD
jgi:molybdopterin-containing oxidoreductase family membrane subunit